MTQLGRISGPLLKDNLLRDGIDLEFSNTGIGTSLLYLDVDNRKVSVNTIGSDTLNVDTIIRSTNVISTAGSTIANIEAGVNQSSTFSTLSGGITLTPEQSDPLTLADQFRGGDIDFKDNIISNYQVNGSIWLEANGSGQVTFLTDGVMNTIHGDLSVTGNFNINGNLSKQGNIIVGNNILEDTVTVVPDFSQSLIPGIDNNYDLGTSSIKWRNIYVHNNSDISTLTYDSLTISNQLQIDGTTREIYTLQSNDSVILTSDTGYVNTENIQFTGDTITNLVPDTPLTFSSTDIGYVRFMGSVGTVIPAGTTLERPASPEVGDTRWNTNLQRIEVFDGSVYNVATGPGADVSQEAMEDLGNIYALILG